MNKYVTTAIQLLESGNDNIDGELKSDKPAPVQQTPQYRMIQLGSSVNGTSVKSTISLSLLTGMPTLDLRDTHVYGELSDYIITSSFNELFVQCDMSDTSWLKDLTWLSQFFPSFSSFYLFMILNDKVAQLDADDSETKVQLQFPSFSKQEIYEYTYEVKPGVMKTIKIPFLGELTLQQSILGMHTRAFVRFVCILDSVWLVVSVFACRVEQDERCRIDPIEAEMLDELSQHLAGCVAQHVAVRLHSLIHSLIIIIIRTIIIIIIIVVVV